MMRLGAILVAFGLLISATGLAVAGIGEAVTAAPITLAEGGTLTVSVPGATAAYSLNSSVADASGANGVVRIRALGGGSTSIIVVLASGTTSLTVDVPFPRGHLALLNAPATRVRQSGSVESSYSSSAGQLSTYVQMEQREGESYRRAWIAIQTFVSPENGRGTGFPLLAYEIGGPGHSLTLLDKALTISPLTFSNVLVRGVHVTDGPWSAHAGATSVAQFGEFLIPQNPQWVFGVTRTLMASRHNAMSANLYDISGSGVLGTIAYRMNPSPHFEALAELGLSRSAGYAVQGHYEDAAQTANVSVLEHPADFASVASNAQQGFFANGDYERAFSTRLNATASAQQSVYAFSGQRQSATSAQANATYALSSNASLSAGVQYSALGARSLSLPISFQIRSKHLSGGVEYQPASNLAGTLANGYGVNAGIDEQRFSAGAFYRRSVDIPTLSAVFGEVPGLQAALNEAGITVNSPADLQALLGNAALLSRLGFSNLSLDLAPVRTDIGVNAMLASPRQTHHISLSYLDSRAKLLDGGSFGFRIASATYSVALGSGNELSATVALLNSKPTYGISIRRRLSTVPALLFPAKRGTIDGYVFEDDAQTGTYASGAKTLAGVSVTLDGGRTATTDSAGHYTFNGVAYGTHEVDAALPQGGFFTTGSPASAEIGDRVDIGVSFVHGRLFGSVTNDAGAAVPGAVVSIAELGQNVTVNDDGTFTVPGVQPGTYTLRISPDSLPPGYDLSSMQPVTVRVQPDAPAPAQLNVRALRSISGTVTLYDARRGVLEPAAGLDVEIPQLGRVSTTDAQGLFGFRNLPAGTFDVQIAGGGQTQRRSVTLSAQPDTQSGIDFRVTETQMQMRSHAAPAKRTRGFAAAGAAGVM